MGIHPDAAQEVVRIVQEAGNQGLTVRVLGGMAVRLHSPSATHRALVRAYPDLDFALGDRRGDRAEALLSGLGYEAHKSFNLLNGDRRLLFFDSEHDRQIDVFVGTFHMCHTIPLAERMAIEPLTLPLAELLLTKLQIVQMNEKDVRDITALLLDHPVAEGDDETINQGRIAELCADDWGLWKTVHVSLSKVGENSAGFDLGDTAMAAIGERVEALRQAIDQMSKTMRWKLRARVGERLPWYDLPEEVQRT